MTYYQIDGKIFYLNLDAIFDMISKVPEVRSSSVTQYYGGEDDDHVDNGKEIEESKSTTNDTLMNIRYDVIKNTINSLLTDRINPDGSIARVIHLTDLSFGQGICMNTLIENNILVEVIQ